MTPEPTTTTPPPYVRQDYAEVLGVVPPSRPGAMMRAARLAQGLGVGEVADRIGVARETLHRWERGPDIPRLKTAVRVADVLQLDRAAFAAALDAAYVDQHPGAKARG
jgi:transcriptional regulator with XRE-family HTH domain